MPKPGGLIARRRQDSGDRRIHRSGIDFGQDFRFELLKNGEGENTAAVLYPEASTVVESLVFRESSSQYYEFETRSLLRIAPNCDPWPVPYK